MRCPELLISSLKDIKSKKPIAQKAILNAINYAHSAPEKIEKLFKEVGKIAHAK